MRYPSGPGPRLLQLWNHLGLTTAHVATQMAGDIAGFVESDPERLGSVVLCVPARLDPGCFAGVADRIVLIAAEQGVTAKVSEHAAGKLSGTARHLLAGYEAQVWSDVVADHTLQITAILAALPPLPPISLPAGSGEHAGITYSVQGAGPPLVLMPFFLSPSQWQPALAPLAERFTVLVLGGAYLGGVAVLEDRAAGHSYRALVNTLWDTMAIRAGDTVLDVGCGSGALDRLLAARLTSGRIIATDVNRFLLHEASQLAAAAELSNRISFQHGNAEQLPFADAAFDAVYTVTVLEECNADQALRELYRVLRPGGRAGVIVRAIDLPQWWNLDLPPGIKRIAEVPPQSVSPTGVANASLYPRLRQAGFDPVRCFPSLVTFANPDGPIWQYREDHVLAQLPEADSVAWHAATARARADGLLFMANPLHCAVGQKPAGDALRSAA